VSDQDFFFDEDEKPTEKKSADKPARKSASGGASSKSAAPAAAAGERTVSMTVTALVGVVALLVGVIVGMFVQPGNSTPDTTAITPGQVQSAPQLSDEQIQQGLPPGHIPVEGAEGQTPQEGTGEATPAAPAE